MRQPKRRNTVTLHLRPDELDAIDVAAKAAGQQRAVWLREIVLQRAAEAALKRTQEETR